MLTQCVGPWDFILGLLHEDWILVPFSYAGLYVCLGVKKGTGQQTRGGACGYGAVRLVGGDDWGPPFFLFSYLLTSETRWMVLFGGWLVYGCLTAIYERIFMFFRFSKKLRIFVCFHYDDGRRGFGMVVLLG